MGVRLATRHKTFCGDYLKMIGRNLRSMPSGQPGPIVFWGISPETLSSSRRVPRVRSPAKENAGTLQNSKAKSLKDVRNRNKTGRIFGGKKPDQKNR